MIAGLRRRLPRVGLLSRFALVSAALVIGIGIVLVRVLDETVEQRALTQSEESVATIGQLVVAPMLSRQDLGSGAATPAVHRRLDVDLRYLLAEGAVSRIKVFNQDGTIFYSDDHDIIGQRQAPDEGLRAALDGEVSSELQASDETDHASEAAMGSLLEVYAPVTIGGDVVGAVELYFPYAPVAADAREDAERLAWWLAAALLVLWAGLLQTMVTASRRLRQHALENQRLAERDALTGLPNRVLFAERVEQGVVGARRRRGSAAVLITDLDRFHEVNDTLGHHMGDKLIVAVGERLVEQLRDTDTVARVGGDEFAVLLPDVSDVADACEAAERLATALRAPFLIDGVSLSISASFGVACHPDHGQDASRLLQRAVIAMYVTKQAHVSVTAYNASLDVNTPERLAMYGELRRGIDDDQLLLHYQPQVDLGSSRVVGVEALVRWQHPERGLLSPDEFIPLAEQTGLICPMTTWVLRTALRQCSTWHAAGRPLSVAVNLSVASLLDDGFCDEVAELLRESGLPRWALELEITESSAMIDPVRAVVVLSDLRALGVRLSIDDYGTGHASLSYLSELPVGTLKIDRSFVMAMASRTRDATIVRSTIELARNLGLQVVAEGVETRKAWRRLVELGCDSAQGYWLARPATAAAVPEIIAELEKRLSTDHRDSQLPV